MSMPSFIKIGLKILNFYSFLKATVISSSAAAPPLFLRVSTRPKRIFHCQKPGIIWISLILPHFFLQKGFDLRHT